MKTLVKARDNYLSLLVWLLAAILLVLLLTKIFVSNQLATTGSLSSLKSLELKNLKQENQKLQNEVSQLGSVNILFEKAGKLGINKVPKIESLPEDSPVALSSQ